VAFCSDPSPMPSWESRKKRSAQVVPAGWPGIDHAETTDLCPIAEVMIAIAPGPTRPES
jgi:hypothetical protein